MLFPSVRTPLGVPTYIQLPVFTEPVGSAFRDLYTLPKDVTKITNGILVTLRGDEGSTCMHARKCMV